MLFRRAYRGDKLLKVTLVSAATQLDQRLLILVQNQPVLSAIDTELMERGTHLRGKSKVCGGAVLIGNDNPQLIHDVALAHTLEERTRKPACDYLGRITGQELGDAGNTMANDVVQKLAGESADPVLLVAQERSRIPRPRDFVAVVAFHVHRPVAQEPTLHESPHAPCDMGELVVMPGSDLEPALAGQPNKTLRFVRVEGEGLLYIDMATRLEANPRQIKVAGWRRSDVNNIRLAFTQQCVNVAEVPFDRQLLAEILRHERFPVTDSDDLASLDPPDLRCMRVGNLAASDDGNLKHCFLRPGRLRNSA